MTEAEERCALIMDDVFNRLIGDLHEKKNSRVMVDKKLRFFMCMVICNIFTYSDSADESLESCIREFRRLFQFHKEQIQQHKTPH